jgi:hypothetical protein
MADYLEYADTIPEFEKVSAEILEEPKPLQEKLVELEKAVLPNLSKRQKELWNYYSKHPVKDEAKDTKIKEIFREYEGWEQGKISGSNGKIAGMSRALSDIGSVFWTIPEHFKFAEKYVEAPNTNPEFKNAARNYIQPEGYIEYQTLYDRLKNGEDEELWGQVGQLSWMYDVIKRGQEQYDKLREKALAGDENAKNEAFNYSFLLWDWKSVLETNRGYNREEPTFFKVKKVRQWLERFHLKLLARGVLGNSLSLPAQVQEKALTTTSGKEFPTTFRPRIVVEDGVGFLQVFRQTKKHRIGGIGTRRFKLVCCLFSPEGTEDAAHNPTLQGYERVFDAIRLPKDDRNSKLESIATAQIEKLNIIKSAIKEFQKEKEVPAGNYLKFAWELNGVRMEVISPRGFEVVKSNPL